MEESENLESFCHGNIPNHSNKQKNHEISRVRKQETGLWNDLGYVLHVKFQGYPAILNFMKKDSPEI